MANRRSKNRKLRRRLSYIAIPLVFAVLGIFGTFFIVDRVDDKISEYSTFIASDTYIKYDNDLYNNYKGFRGKAKDTFDNTSVVMPYTNEQYAIIKCEELGIKAPLYWGDSDIALQSGAGTYTGSSLPGYGSAVLVSAHNTTFFKNLKNAKAGNVFSVKTNYADFEYRVSKVKVVTLGGESPIDFDSENEQLVLYTCYPFSPMSAVTNQRLFVYCDKISGPVAENVEVDIG